MKGLGTMFGFPPKERLQSIIGKEIVQVGIGRHQVTIVLHTQEFITIESTSSFYDKNKSLVENRDNDPPIFDDILSKKILDVNIISKRVAELILQDGFVIKLNDDSDEFESITFNLENDTIAI
jgi:hypothetical protein